MSGERSTRRCPDCAEDVWADARICRYCRHVFAAAASPLEDQESTAPAIGLGMRSALVPAPDAAGIEPPASQPERKRGLRDAILFPSPLGLLVSLALLAVPLLWPLTLYMWLRSLTGHRAPGGAGRGARLRILAAAVVLLLVVLAAEAAISYLSRPGRPNTVYATGKNGVECRSPGSGIWAPLTTVKPFAESCPPDWAVVSSYPDWACPSGMEVDYIGFQVPMRNDHTPACIPASTAP